VNTTITVSSVAATYPASLLKDSLRKRRWRATGFTNEHIIFLLPADETVCCFAITGHNLSETAQIDVARSQDGNTYVGLATITITPQASVGYDEGFYGFGGYGGVTPSEVLPGSTQYVFFSAVDSSDWPYWKVTIMDPSNADGFIEVGRVYLGSHWEPTNQIVPGWNITVVDDSEIITLVSGQKIDNPKDRYLQISFRLPHLSVSDAISNFLTIINDYKVTKKDIFLVLFPNGDTFLKDVTTIYGRFLGDSQIGIQQIGYNTFDTGQVTFEESL